jgi:hypothetical protein
MYFLIYCFTGGQLRAISDVRHGYTVHYSSILLNDKMVFFFFLTIKWCVVVNINILHEGHHHVREDRCVLYCIVLRCIVLYCIVFHENRFVFARENRLHDSRLKGA